MLIRQGAEAMLQIWCPVCDTDHGGTVGCPGELTPVAPEKTGWRVTVETPHGPEAYGVMIADCGDFWRARIFTFPNVLWKTPGLPGSIKFAGKTGREALERAVEFVLRHCLERGHKMRGDRFIDPPPGPARTGASVAVSGPAPRKVRFLPLRFGVVNPSEAAGTGNLSETGLYIITPSPLDPGNPLRMSIHLQNQDTVALDGRVIWTTRSPRNGTPPGMGVILAGPPPDYVEYVRQLA